MIHRRFAARTLGVVAALVLASCFGEGTGPLELRPGRLAIAPLFDAQALRLVPVDRVHIVLYHADNSVALDTTVVFPANTDTLDLSFNVPIQGASEQLGLDLEMLDPGGAVVFRAPRTTVTATAGGSTPPPATPPLLYVGPGANAVGIQFLSTAAQVFFGDTVLFTAEAFDANNVVVPTAPLAWSSSDTSRARLPDPALGRFVGNIARGPATVKASLLRTSVTTPPAEVSSQLLVQPKPNQIAVHAGNNQTGPVGAPLLVPVNARVRAIDNLGVQGVTVTFVVTSGGGSVSAPTAVTDANGDASVTWTLGPTLGAQVVTATAAGVAGASAAFNATGQVGTATQLAFTTQPGNSAANTAIAPPVQVEIRDAFGNRTSSTANVTLAIGANPGTSTLSGTTTVAAIAGVATFSNVSLNNAGTGYTLTASSSGLTGATSTAFSVSGGVPTQLAFISQPTTATAGGAITAFQVAVRDVNNNTVTGATNTVTLNITGNPAGVTLSGTVSAAAVNGLATFSNISINRSGTGYTLTAGATGLTSATSSAFAINAGPASQLAFTTQPPATVLQSTPFVVEVSALDALGNIATAFTGSVTAALGANPGGGTLAGTPTVAAVSGTATFNTLEINNTGTGYTLTGSAAGLTGTTSNAFDVGLSASINQWTNPSGGNWSVPGNWSKGTVPVSTEAVAIVLGGAYTVNVDIAPDFASLTLGGSSGSQVLDASSRTFANPITVGPGGVLTLVSSTVTGSLANQGLVLVRGSSAVNGALTNTSTSVIRVEGNGTQGTGQLTVATGFSNTGAIELTSVGSGFPAQLTVSSGTLTNASSGTISALPGVGGARTFTGQLDNQGTLTVSAPLAWNQAAVAATNSGTIDVSGGDLTLSTGGGSLTNTGAVTVAASRTWTLSSGTLNQNGGALGGAGTLSLNSMTANFAVAFTNAATTLLVSSSTLNGPGSLTNAAGRTLVLLSSTIGASMAFDNQGLVLVRGSSAINGTLTTGTGSTLQIEGNGSQGTGLLTVASGFSNTAAIELTSVGSGFPAQLTVTSGTLTNGGGGTISALPGVGGARTLDAQLDNQGTLTVAGSQGLTLGRAGADHVSNNTINVTGGDLTIAQSGTTPTFFLNNGTINFGAGRTLTVTGGVFDDLNGVFTGGGTLAFSSATLNLVSTTVLNTSGAALTLSSSTVNGPGDLTNAAGRTLILTSSTVNANFDNQGLVVARGSSAISGLTTAAGSTLQVEGNGAQGTGLLTVAGGFLNQGTIELTSAGSGFPAQFTLTAGTITNASTGVIRSLPGVGGARTFNAALDNQGLVTAQTTIAFPMVVSSAGTLSAQSGALQFGGGGTFANAVNTSGGGVFELTAGDYGLSANLLVNGDMRVSGTAAFDNLNGRTITITGTFETAGNGRLDMSGVNDSLIVLGNATFGGSTVGTLIRGTLVLGGDLNQVGAGAQFRATGDHLTVFNGPGVQSVSFQSPGGSASRFAHLVDIKTAGSLTLLSDIDVTDTLDLMNTTVPLFGPSRKVILHNGALLDTAQISPVFLVGELVLRGQPVAMPAVLPSGLTIDSGFVSAPAFVVAAGDLHITGNATVDMSTPSGSFSTGANLLVDGNGVMLMGNVSGVTVSGNATFSSNVPNNGLTQGTLSIGGNFLQSGHPESFAVTGSHQTMFVGTAPQTIQFTNPGFGAGFSQFSNLTVAQPVTVTMLSPVFANGVSMLDGTLTSATQRLSVSGGSVNLQSPATLSVRALEMQGSISNSGATYNVDTTIFAGGPTMAVPNLPFNHVAISGFADWLNGPPSISGSLTVSGDLNVNDGTIVTAGDFATTGSGVIHIVNGEQMTVNGNVTFGGGDQTGLLASGTLSVRGSFAQTSGTSAQSFAAGAGFTVVMDGTAAQSIAMATPGPTQSQFGELQVANSTAPVTVAGDVRVGGNLTMLAGAGLTGLSGRVHVVGTLTTNTGSTFTPRHLGIEGGMTLGSTIAPDTVEWLGFGRLLTTGPLVNYGTMIVNGTGNWTLTAPDTLAGGLTVNQGILTLNGNSLRVGADFATASTGVIEMLQAGDSVLVTGDVTFGGGNQNGKLLDGLLRVGGNFLQDGTTSTASFNADPPHTVEFAGSALQTVEIRTPGFTPAFAHFGIVRFANAGAGVSLLTNADAHILEDLTSGTQEILFGGGRLFTAEGLNVTNMRFDNTRVSVTDPQPITAFDNVTFTNYPTNPDILTIARTVNPPAFAGLVFPTAGFTGRYLVANEIGGGPLLAVTLTGATPGPGSGLCQTTGGATISWNGGAC